MADSALDIDGVDDAFPLNPAQLGMLFHSLAEPDTGVYVGILDAILPDDLDQPLFERAWDQVVAQHDALRSVVVWQGVDVPLQVVRSDCKIEWETLDEPLAEEGGRVSREFVEDFRKSGIDLAKEPAMRFATGRLENGKRCFIWACHHALIDDWSQALVLRDVQSTYQALRAGRDPLLNLSPPIGKFADWLEDRDGEADETFWRRTFGDLATPTRLQLPGSAQRQGGDNQRTERFVCLDKQTSDRIREAANDARVTLAAVATGVWAVVLHRVTGALDVPFGLAATLRPPEIDGIDNAIGNFVTTIPARSKISDHETLRELIKAKHDFVQEAQPRSSVALSRIQEFAGVPQGEPLLDTILSIKKDALAVLDSGQEPLFSDPSIQFKSNFPLAIVVMPGDQIGLKVIFDPRRHKTESIEQLLTWYASALASVPESMNLAPTSLNLLTPDARAIAKLGLVGEPLTNVPDVVAAFRSIAARCPDALAVQDANGARTYEEFLQAVDAIAARLSDAGVKRGDRVGLYLDRSLDVPIAMFGCLAAGAAYVPFDAAFPEGRLDRMIDAADLSAIITSDAHFARMAARNGRLFKYEDMAKPYDGCVPQVSLTNTDVAYLMFTSGTTGTPKGVVVSHGNLSASTAARTDWYGSDPERFLLLSSHAFDSSVAGIYWTLTTGGTLYIADENEVRSIPALKEMFENWQITHTLCLPSLYRLLLDTAHTALRSVETVIVAGEAAAMNLIENHRSTGQRSRLVNEYGPTEATVWCTAADLTDIISDEEVPIGGPIPGATLHILDEFGRPVPVGLPGELCVGGAGLSQGYANNPKDNETAFIKGPDGSRVYRTGDVVSQRNGGALTYLGRADRQVKIRGYRVELSEVEDVLASRPDIREAVCAVFDEQQDARLVGFVQAKEGTAILPEDLAKTCEKALPSFMVPSRFVLLAQLPRTSNGKVDRDALKEPGRTAPDADIVEAATPTESVLSELWRVALWLDRKIGINEDFHDLGGHSLVAIRLLNDIHETFGISLPSSSVGRITTVEEQAKHIETARVHGEQVQAPVSNARTPDALAGLSDDDDAKLMAMVSNWTAPPARPDFKTRIANANGTLPPLFFCFLDEYSFKQLSEAMGPEQPIFGIRASNGVIPLTGEEESEANLRRTALSYLNEVLELADDGPIMLAGYCQGATIAFNLAALMTVLQRSVGTIISIEKTPPIEYSGHVDLIFAEQSFLNPFLRFDQPERVWERRYRSHSFETVPGDYQKVFLPQHVIDLASTLRRKLADARTRATSTLPKSARALEWGARPEVDPVKPGRKCEIQITLRNAGNARWPATAQSGLRIEAVWKDADDNPTLDSAMFAELLDPVAARTECTAHLIFKAPDKEGQFALEVDLVEEGVISFSKAGNPKLLIPIIVSENAAETMIANIESQPRAIDRLVYEIEATAHAALLQSRSINEPSLQIDEALAATLAHFATIQLRNGQAAAAGRLATAALQVDPNRGEAQLVLARAHIAQGRHIEAMRVIFRAKSLGGAVGKEAADLLALHYSARAFARSVRNKFGSRSPTARTRTNSKRESR